MQRLEQSKLALVQRKEQLHLSQAAAESNGLANALREKNAALTAEMDAECWAQVTALERVAIANKGRIGCNEGKGHVNVCKVKAARQ